MEKITRTKVRNFLNKTWQEISNKRYRDDDWFGFRWAVEYLQNKLDDEFRKDTVKIYYYTVDGGYRQTSDKLTTWKEYIIEVKINGIPEIKGYINCCACGPIDNPFSVYDMVFVNWLNDENETLRQRKES